MSPALLVLIIATGSALLVGGVLAAALGWLPLAAGIGIAAVGGLVETAAMLAFVRARKQAAQRPERR